jgi:hypothetical protein
MGCHVYLQTERPGDPRVICGNTLKGLLGHPQQSPLCPFPHKRGRKRWGLPLIATHGGCIAARRPHNTVCVVWGARLRTTPNKLPNFKSALATELPGDRRKVAKQPTVTRDRRLVYRH